MDLAEVGRLGLSESSIFPIYYKGISKWMDEYQESHWWGVIFLLDLPLTLSMVILTLSFMKSSTNYSLLMCPSPLTSISQKMLRMEACDSFPSRNLAISS